MNKILLLISVLIVVQLNAQLSFYIKPVIDFKIDVSSAKAFGFSDKILNTNPYYSYDNMAFRNPFHGLSLGAMFGAKTKNGKYNFEIGLCNDETQSGFKVTTNSFNGTYNYQSSFGVIDGRSFTRVAFQGAAKLYQFKNKSNVSFIVGFSFSPRQSTFQNHVLNQDGFTTRVGENTFMDYSSSLYIGNMKNMFLNFGFSSEIYSKNKYLFDLNIFYNQGFHYMTQVQTSIKIYDNTSSNENKYLSLSKGSGIYLQLARKFQVYPWRPNKKEGI